jgi:undecaprenyl-diphosphatase
MILVMPWIGIDANADPFWNDVFNFFIQIGAILAVVVYFWRRLWRLSFKQADSSIKNHIMTKLVVAMIPTGILGVLLDDFMKEHLMKVPVVAAALIVGGVAILGIQRAVRQPRYHDAGTIPLRLAFMIGLMQCLAMIPGTSRSGASIMGALLLGLSPAAAAEFSFFLAIPTLMGAGLLSLVKGLDGIEGEHITILATGFFVSFIVALAVVHFFMQFIKNHNFTSFAIYRIVIGIVVFALFWGKSVSPIEPPSTQPVPVQGISKKCPINLQWLEQREEPPHRENVAQAVVPQTLTSAGRHDELLSWSHQQQWSASHVAFSF